MVQRPLVLQVPTAQVPHETVVPHPFDCVPQLANWHAFCGWQQWLA